MVDVRGTTEGVVRYERNMILPVLLGAHADRGRLVTPKLSLVWFGRYTTFKI